MANLTMPFTMENKVDDHDIGFDNCELYKELPPPLKKVTRDNPHLLEYLHIVPIHQVGLPQYYPELPASLSDIKEPNLIYPSKLSGVFIHILVNFKGVRNHYIPVEPPLMMDLDSLLTEVENKCIAHSANSPDFDPSKDRLSQLLEYIDQVTTFTDQPGPGFFNKYIRLLRKRLLRKDSQELVKVKITQRELEGIRYLFKRDKIGLGILEVFVTDPNIEDISCSGLGHIFIEHKIFKSLKSTVTFSTLDELDEFVIRLSERIGKSVTYKNPIIDATLPNGSRINIVFGRDISKRGSNFSIRRFNETPISIMELVDFGTVNYQMLAYLSLTIGNGMNVFVAGESASGKTSLLNAVTTFISPQAKIITIEDTPELQVPQKNWIREVVQSTKVDDAGGAVTMFDLLKAALRQRPNEILVGEIRGPEGNIAFQAMQTGHSVMATFHAASVEKLIQRLTSAPISVPRTYIDNLHIVVIMSLVKLPTGKMARRVTNISEIVGWDPVTESFNIVESFQWDEAIDKVEFTGYMTSYILEHKIAGMIGIPSHKKQRIYKELDRRAKILSRMHKEQGITGFHEVLAVLSKAQREGLF